MCVNHIRPHLILFWYTHFHGICFPPHIHACRGLLFSFTIRKAKGLIVILLLLSAFDRSISCGLCVTLLSTEPSIDWNTTRLHVCDGKSRSTRPGVWFQGLMFKAGCHEVVRLSQRGREQVSSQWGARMAVIWYETLTSAHASNIKAVL